MKTLAILFRGPRGTQLTHSRAVADATQYRAFRKGPRSLASHSLPSRELTPDTDGGGFKLQSYQRLGGRRVAGFIRKAGNQSDSR